MLKVARGAKAKARARVGAAKASAIKAGTIKVGATIKVSRAKYKYTIQS
jgi:hypothetical protein